MAESKSKQYDYREWAESFVDFVDSKAQHNLAEDLRLTLKNLDPNAMIYEPALAPAARIWTVVLASAAILVSKNSSAIEKKHEKIILDHIAEILDITRREYDKYMIKAKRVHDGFVEIESGSEGRLGDLGLDTGCLAMDLQFDIYDDFSPVKYHSTPADENSEMDSIFERYNLPRLRAASVYIPMVPNFTAIAYDWFRIGRWFADKYMF